MNKKVLGILVSSVVAVVLSFLGALWVYQVAPDVQFEEEYLLFLPDVQWVVLAEVALMFFLAEMLFIWGWCKRLCLLDGVKCYFLAGLYFLLCSGFSLVVFMLVSAIPA